MRFTFLTTSIIAATLLSACSAVAPASAPASENSNVTASATAHEEHANTPVDEATPFDAQFIDSMIEHHQGAIDMAQMALEEAEHDELRTLADTIIAAQEGEIEQMQAWRSEWYPDLATTEGMQMGMGEMMISEDESTPFDQRFLEAMISHHQGAIDMAGMALEQAEHEEIRTLAAAIIAAQEGEIDQMQGWLAEWYNVTQ